jgi:tetratricopeptide (TPR) repeat protein
MARRIIQFNILAVTALIATFFPGGQVLAVETYFEKHGILADIAFQYAAVGKSEQAVKILNQVLPLAEANPNECFKANPLVKVALGYIQAGQEAKGKQLLKQAIHIARTQTATRCSGSGTSPDESLLNRAKEYAEAGYYGFAIELITGVNNPVFTPITMAEVAGHYAKAGEDEQATTVLKQALAIAQRNDHALYRTMTLIVIAEHLSQAGQKEQVPQVLEGALKSASAIDEAQSGENASMKISQMLRIVKQFAFIGQERRAIELLDQSLPKIRTLPGKRFPLDKISQLIETAAQYAALEQKNKALSTLAEAQKAAQAIDEAQSKSDALASVADAYAELGNFDQARQIARAIENVNARKRAFLGIAIAYGKAGYSDQAVKLATSIGNRDATFRGIVRHYLNSGQYDQAFEIIQQWNFKDMLSEVAFGYLETGQPERALQITLSIQPPLDARHKDWRFSAIARGFAKQGKFDQALQLAQAITDKSYKAQALTAIAEQYVAREREKKGPIEKIFFVLTNSYNSLFGSSNKDKASKILDQALQVAQSMAPKRATQ